MATKEQEALNIHVGFGFYGTPAYNPSVYKQTEAVLNEMKSMPDGDYHLITYVTKDNKINHAVTDINENEEEIVKGIGVEKAYMSDIHKAGNKFDTISATVSLIAPRRKSFTMTDIPFERKENERISELNKEFVNLKIGTPEFVKFAVYVVDARYYTDAVPGKSVEYLVAKAKDNKSLMIAPIAKKDSGGTPLELYQDDGNKTPFKNNLFAGDLQVHRLNRDNLEIKTQPIQKKVAI